MTATTWEGNMAQTVYSERDTGRRYILVRRPNPAGACMDAATGRRYNVIKRYVTVPA